MTWHLHYSGESRDCDGKYNYGRDIPARKGLGSYGDLSPLAFALELVQREPDDISPVFIRIDHDHLGRVTIQGGGETEEGYWRESYVICEDDDYDPGYSGFRDHTAESMGY